MNPVVNISVSALHRPEWRRWLGAFAGYTILSNTAFTSALWVIYLAAHGFDPLAIGLFEMVFHLAKLIAEVPTGIFADLVGRRKSLIIYTVLNAVETLLFLIPNVGTLTLSFALSGISLAFRGGANDAMLWTIAGEAAPDKQALFYSKWISRMFLLSLGGEVIGVASGGYLGEILEFLPFACRSIFLIAAVIPLLLLPEQKVEGAAQTSPYKHLRAGLRAVGEIPALLGMLLIGGLTESCWQTVYFYYQLYLHDQGYSLEIIGLIVAASMGASFFFTAIAPIMMRWLPSKKLIPLCVIAEMSGLLLMSFPQPIVSICGYLILFQASVGILSPALSTYINEICPEGERATILSLQTGFFSGAMIVLFPLFGLGLASFSYSTIYLGTLVVLLGGSMLIVAIQRLIRLTQVKAL